MNTFRTEINCSPTNAIGLDNKILSVGSCFADHLGHWLTTHKFSTLVNPFGTTYNPISIHHLVLDALTDQLDLDLLTERDGLWFHHGWHSQFNTSEKTTLPEKLRRVQMDVRAFLQQVDVVMITYGTAWVYELLATNQLVNNCHKVPGTQFRKRLLSLAEIQASFHTFQQSLRSIRPDVRIICTVSPVRHLKDSLELNQVSKAVLRLACHQWQQEKLAEYFPAYEIMMDDLRDYRFYERDKIHPSAEARDYIIEKFSDRYFSADTRELLQTLQAIQKSLAHVPFQVASSAHQNFLRETLRKLESIRHRLPVTAEMEHVRGQLL